MYKIFAVTALIIVTLAIVTTSQFAKTPSINTETSKSIEITKVTAKNNGIDLELVWKEVENANEYALYCDQMSIGKTKENSYIINGILYDCDFLGCRHYVNVCKEIEIITIPRFGGEKRRVTLDLSPKVIQISGISTNDISDKYWIKIDFSTNEVKVVSENEVDPNKPNTGWIAFFNNNGKPELRDLGETGKGFANMVISFGRGYLSPYLSPDSKDYTKKITISSAGDKIFFWADNRENGYGKIDANDYFGVIIVKSLVESDDPLIYKGVGPYKVDLEIFIQDKVRGLRWIKY